MELPPFNPIVKPARVAPAQINSLRHLLRLHNLENPEESILYPSAHVAISSHNTAEIWLDHEKTTPLRKVPLYYKYRSVPKHSGGRRILSEPSSSLKSLQRWILRHCFTDDMVSPAAYAYRPGLSIKDCAAVHTGAKWLIKFDLKDFFGGISEVRVYELFRAIGYKELVAFELARLTTFLPDKNIRRNIQALYNEKFEITPAARNYTKLEISIDSSDDPYPRYRDSAGKIIRGVLPQGAPTSGIIANICAGELDKQLASLALSNGLRYSRYCDDLFFSPRPEHEHFDRSFAGLIIRDVNRAVLKQGFRINQGKTRVVPPGSKKLILGLQVDDRVRLDTAFKKNIDYHIRGIAKFGLQQHVAHAKGSPPPVLSFLNHLQGLIAFAKGIDYWYGETRETNLRKALSIGEVTR